MSAASGGAVDFFGREMNKKISPLTRNELAKELMSETGSYSDAYQFIGKFFDVLSDEITNRGHVKVHGFGVFRCLQKKARIGRNPKTGEVAKITPRRVGQFYCRQ